MVVRGHVTSVKYQETEYSKYINYQVKVDQIIRGDGRSEITNVTTLFMQHDCEAASEMHWESNRSECMTQAPKINSKQVIYLNHSTIMCEVAPCPSYYQAVIYKDSLSDYRFVPDPSTNILIIIIVSSVVVIALGAAVSSIMIIKKKKHISKKKS